MKITEKYLRQLIHESINNVFNTTQESEIEKIFREYDSKVNEYERYAQQLRGEIETLGELFTDIADAINTTFSTRIQVKDFYNAEMWIDNELTCEVNIPITNFLTACKNNDEVVRYLSEYPNTEEGIIECACDSDWELFTSDGRELNRDHHKFSFKPDRVAKNGVVPCTITITNAFITWD